MVLGNSLERVADEAHAPRLDVGEAAEIVEQFARRGIGRQSIDGEVAPRRVFLPVVGKGDRRSAAIGRDVAAERGDLDRPAVADGGDGAMIDPRRHRLDPCRLEAGHDVIGQEAGGEVEVADRQAEQLVAHRSADIARHPGIGVERFQHARHAAPLAPFRGVELHRQLSLRDRLTIIAAVAPQILRPFHSIS